MSGHNRPGVCRTFAAGQVCAYGESCHFGHDEVAFASTGGGGGGSASQRREASGPGGGISWSPYGGPQQQQQHRGGGGGRGNGHHYNHHHHHNSLPAFRARAWHPPLPMAPPPAPHGRARPPAPPPAAAPAAAPPPFPVAAAAAAFRVMSYNALSDGLALAHAAQLYPRASAEHLAWERRWRLLELEVRELAPGVLCLQEVDAARWPAVQHALRRLGYAGAHARRTGDRGDGCAVLWRSDAWEAVPLPGGEQGAGRAGAAAPLPGEGQGAGRGGAAAPQPHHHPHPPQHHHVLRFAEHGLRDNVAVSALLRPRRAAAAPPPPKRARSATSGVAAGAVAGAAAAAAASSGRARPDYEDDDAGNNESSFMLLVSTTHLIFNPKRGDTKLGQLRTLLTQLHAQASAAANAAAATTAMAASCRASSSPPDRPPPPVVVFPVVTGDLNAAPDSAVYAFATRGELDCLLVDRRSLSGVVESAGADSPFRLWAGAQRRHYQQCEAAAAAASSAASLAYQAAAQAAAAGGRAPRAPRPAIPAPPPPPPDAADVVLGGGAPLAWLRPHQRRVAEAAREGGGGGAVPVLALLQQLGWDEEGMAQATGRRVDRGGEGRQPSDGEEEDETDEHDSRRSDDDDDDDSGGGDAVEDEAGAEQEQGGGAHAFVARHPWPGGLASAYASVAGREPAFTSVHARFAGALDYVLYHEVGCGGGGGARGGADGGGVSAGARRPPRLRAARVLLPPPLQLLLPPRAPPSAGVPSDHVSMVVDFEVLV